MERFNRNWRRSSYCFERNAVRRCPL